MAAQQDEIIAISGLNQYTINLLIIHLDMLK